MIALILVVAIIILILLLNSRNQAAVKSRYLSQQQKSASDLRHQEPLAAVSRIAKVSVRVQTSSVADDSIIDVTGASYPLNSSQQDLALTQAPRGVVDWQHQYIYSFSDLNGASREQAAFYHEFKARFLKGIFYDLKGNTNYCFILLFDLLESYPREYSAGELEHYLEILGACYPRTLSYGRNFLLKIYVRENNQAGIQRMEALARSFYAGYSAPEKLGDRYKSSLQLSEAEAAHLNHLSSYSNTFFDIPGCDTQVIRLCLQLIERLDAHFSAAQSSFNEQVELNAGRITNQQYHYKTGTANYRYMTEQVTRDIYYHLLKFSECALREQWGHKRKQYPDLHFLDPKVREQYEREFILPARNQLAVLATAIPAPGKSIQIELNAQNTTRWKHAFQDLTSATDARDAAVFLQRIQELAELNKKNPSIELIYFEASKFISKIDRHVALQLYVYYIYHDLQSEKFDNRQLTKTIQKSLFTSPEQLEDFKHVLNRLITTRNLEEALHYASDIYKAKRKKIKLNASAIQEVQQQHSETVDILNEFLQDDEAVETVVLDHVAPFAKEDVLPVLNSGILVNPIHRNTLAVFAKNNFMVTGEDLETFARQQGVFKNQLVESINDACYEYLDDVLIEEEEDNYLISEPYYEKIINA